MTGQSAAKEAEALRAHGQALLKLGRELLARANALDGKKTSAPASLSSEAEVLILAKAAQDDRKRRLDFFRKDLFGEPAWDILLDVFIQERIGKPLSVMASYIGSAASTGTAHRYLKLLISDGLIERTGDPKDNRRSFLTLTPEAKEAMVEYLATGTFLGRSGLALEARPD
ncbi:MAG TPA: hypothetical protein VEC60_12235 [Reyranella sp.]|nr:hypothetical protein [Reyranella sp.]